MSLLAHLVYGAPRMDVERKGLDARIQFEIREAQRVQTQTGCTWSEALRIAARAPREQASIDASD